jgi:hypothetical protein
LQNYKSSGALNKNGQPGTVDLRSNGYGRARAPWTASCSRCTGPRWTGRITRRGTRSGSSTQDLTALDVCTRWAAAASPECGGARQELAGAALDHAVGHRFASERDLRVAERHAHASRGSGRWIGLPRRPAPEGGGAGFAGVRAPVLRCELKGKTAGKMLLTTRGNVGRAHGRRGGSRDGVRRRLGRRSGGRGPKLQALLDSGGGFPWSTSIT